MKHVLIISPYFPPSNAADVQRVRMSLPYFEKFGWAAEVVAVKSEHSEVVPDPLLLETVPQNIAIHYVDAFPKKWTAKVGLGNLALRSLWYYRKKVNGLLKAKKYDLIYFSTTQFPICILGAYWKRKFNVPYVIDMQDPWRSDYYLSKPKAERPPKFWFSYRLDKWLEPIAMKSVSGLIAVSQAYLDALSQRYHHCSTVPQRVITFGAFDRDSAIAMANLSRYPPAVDKKNGTMAVVYIGRGGDDMQPAIKKLFHAFADGLSDQSSGFEALHFYFIGTSYAAAGTGRPTVTPIANELGLTEYVTEITNRLPFYQTLNTLAAADALFIPGSDDPQYTASKLYPYIAARRPLLAIFHPASSATSFLRATGAATLVTFDDKEYQAKTSIQIFLKTVASKTATVPQPDKKIMDVHSAQSMTQRQCELFGEVIN